MKRKPKTILVLLLVAAGAVLSLLWFARGRRSGDQGPATYSVARRTFTSTVLATGAVKPQVGAEVRVGARVSGKVEVLHTNVGAVVEKGDAIADLEKADLKAMVAQRQAELDIAEGKLSAAQALLPVEIEKAEADVTKWDATVALAQKELVRQDDLLKQNFTSLQAGDQAQEQLLVAEAQLSSTRKALELTQIRYAEELKQGRAEVQRAKAALANSKVQLSYATITAPILGVIGSVSTQEGETVAAGLNAPTFVTIIDLKRLQVDAFVDEVDIGKVKEGQHAVFTVDAFPAREFEGKVAAIYPKAVVLENVVNYDVVIEITTAYHGFLRPEMTASVTIFLEARENLLAVPVKALRRERGKSVVYVLVNDQPQQREVAVGWRDGQWVEVVAGLEEGDLVLLEPPHPESARP
ncbi:MAG: efflux RND transporter periplasmic adaptor subunit [bacterium]|nr:efflux RND transporter periplasmic adaptor subunit [bacterium]